MSLYSVYDLSETLKRINISRESVERAIYAWGDTWGPNSLVMDEPYDSIQGDDDWHGGFILKLIDGKVICIEGKCDSSGWGCVDEVTIKQINHMPDNWNWKQYQEAFSVNSKIKADKDPIDLNRWIHKEIELKLD